MGLGGLTVDASGDYHLFGLVGSMALCGHRLDYVAV